jgi:hypothetical protein
LKRHHFIGCFVCVLSIATLSHAQAVPTASRLGGRVALGVGGTLINPDFAQTKIKAVTFFADVDLVYSLGLEGEIHYSVITPSDISENSYLVGPRYVVRKKRVEIYAKGLLGVGHFGLQAGSNANPATATYFEYALGGGIDIRASRHFNIRAIDFEAQKWPSFPTNGLSPYSGTIGVSYVFH